MARCHYGSLLAIGKQVGSLGEIVVVVHNAAEEEKGTFGFGFGCKCIGWVSGANDIFKELMGLVEIRDKEEEMLSSCLIEKLSIGEEGEEDEGVRNEG